MTSPARSRPRRRGFTLIELMVALTVGAFALLAVRTTLVQLGGAADRARAAARAADREANADRLLRGTVGQIETGLAPGRRFAGDPQAATFATWCDTPAGDHAPCRARLGVDSTGTDAAGGAFALTLTLGTAAQTDTIVLRPAPRGTRLRYLTDPAAGGQWVAAWPPAITPPLAIGVVTDADTTILRIGPRG